jgi:hypothetical protein
VAEAEAEAEAEGEAEEEEEDDENSKLQTPSFNEAPNSKLPPSSKALRRAGQ